MSNHPYRPLVCDSPAPSPRRKPVPTPVPSGDPTVNYWLHEWAVERRELEVVEADRDRLTADLARVTEERDAALAGRAAAWKAQEIAADGRDRARSDLARERNGR